MLSNKVIKQDLKLFLNNYVIFKSRLNVLILEKDYINKHDIKFALKIK